MSKQQELYSLFGIKSPQQVRAERRAKEEAFMRSLQTAEAQAGGALGMGLSRLFGKPSEEELEAQRAEAIMADAMQAEGGEIAKTAAMANRFREAGMPKAAMAALQRLNELKQAEEDRRYKQGQRELENVRIVNREVPVTYVSGYDELGQPKYGQRMQSVPHRYDLRTQELVPLFDTAASAAVDPAPAGTGDVTTVRDNEGGNPADRATATIRQQLEAIPEGQTRRISTGSFYKNEGGKLIKVDPPKDNRDITGVDSLGEF